MAKQVWFSAEQLAVIREKQVEAVAKERESRRVYTAKAVLRLCDELNDAYAQEANIQRAPSKGAAAMLARIEQARAVAHAIVHPEAAQLAVVAKAAEETLEEVEVELAEAS